MALKVLISVTSDLTTDQRVNRTACTFKDLGYDVLVIGRKLKSSNNMPATRFRSLRFKLFFEKGPFFYANYNIRLFRYLMSQKANLLFSNDLDTLLPNYLVSRIKKIPLIYDSHEYFTGVPELEGRPFVKGTWKRIESFIIPRLKCAITVNQSIADLYTKEYGTPFHIIRNVPIPQREEAESTLALRQKLDLPQSKKIVILQGAGINIQRGAEEAVAAMKFLDNTLLLIVGDGDVVPDLKKFVAENSLEEKVRFAGKKTVKELRKYTAASDLGLTLDKDTNLNYRFSLPNKLFDYIQAGIPVLASDLPEVKRIVEDYKVGVICPDHNPKTIAGCIKNMLEDDSKMQQWKNNCKKASAELNWDREQSKLIAIINKVAR